MTLTVLRVRNPQQTVMGITKNYLGTVIACNQVMNHLAWSQQKNIFHFTHDYSIAFLLLCSSGKGTQKGLKSRGLGRRLWLLRMSSRAQSRLRPSHWAWPSLGFWGLAWPGFGPEAEAGTSLRIAPSPKYYVLKP